MSDIRLDDNNNVILDGNVGIGTNNPTNKLHLVGSGPVTIENPDGGEADILFKSGNNQSWQVGTNLNGWYVWDNNYRFVVKPGGNVGIGTNNPTNKLHVEGSEIHSGGGGSGFSFDDRTKGNGDRWVWYAQNGVANLWSQKMGLDILSVHLNNGAFQNHPHLSCLGIATSTIKGSNLFNSPFDLFLIGRVKLEGTLQSTGAITQGSSIALKENVSELSGQEAMQTLQGLNAVKYNYKADNQKEQHIGFIAEDVPDLVANSERDRLSPMDLIAVLTKAVQEQEQVIQKQQQAIAKLAVKVDAFEEQHS